MSNWQRLQILQIGGPQAHSPRLQSAAMTAKVRHAFQKVNFMPTLCPIARVG